MHALVHMNSHHILLLLFYIISFILEYLTSSLLYSSGFKPNLFFIYIVTIINNTKKNVPNISVEFTMSRRANIADATNPNVALNMLLNNN